MPYSALSHLDCPRCGAHLHLRKPDSIVATWGFLIAAYALSPIDLIPDALPVIGWLVSLAALIALPSRRRG